MTITKKLRYSKPKIMEQKITTRFFLKQPRFLDSINGLFNIDVIAQSSTCSSGCSTCMTCSTCTCGCACI